MNYITIQTLLFAGSFLLASLLILPCQSIFKIRINSAQRDLHLDGLRGIAAIMVVACHVNQHLLSFFGLTNYCDIGNRFGHVGVQMFFALTAYLFIKRALNGNFDPLVFYLSRIHRIVPLYLFVVIMTLIITFSLPSVIIPSWHSFIRDCINVLSFGFLGSDTLLVEGYNAKALIGIAWSLSYEWKFYLVLPPLYYLYSYSKKISGTLAILILLFAVRDFYEGDGKIIWPFFIVGGVSAILMSYCSIKLIWLKKIISFCFFVFFISSLFFPGFSYWQFLIALVLFPCLLLGEPKFLTIRPLVALGQISYSLYLVQYLILMPIVTKAWLGNILMATPLWKFIIAYSVICLLIPFSCFTYKFIELKWMHNTVLPQKKSFSVETLAA